MTEAMPWRGALALLTILAVTTPQSSFAQDAGGTAGAPPAQAQPQDDPDLDLDFAQPDFNLVALPTTLRLPRHKGAFRVTHRFLRSLGSGDVGDLAGDLFGLDSGAQIGLEFRLAPLRGTQVGIHRTSDKTIEFFGQQSVFQQGSSLPVALGVLLSVEGTDNFQEQYSTAIGVAVSRTMARRLALYVEPVWVDNTNPLDAALADEDDTFMVGLGIRVRVLDTVYLSGEMAPRATGYTPGVTYGSFGLEKRAGGHMFQLNVSNGFGTTMGQVARGGFTRDDWYFGFSISRKFY